MRKFIKTAWVAVGLTVLGSAQAGVFEEGVRAFRSGDYDAAIHAFEGALAQGQKDARIWYNLGSSYYRAGRHEKAAEAFARVPEDSPLWPAARYNLGLIARKTGDERLAKKHFREALAAAGDSGIARLARERLAELKQAERPVWRAYVQAGIGHDDNVNFAPLGIASKRADQFLDLYGSGAWDFAGNRDRGWTANAFFSYTDYFKDRAFDYNDVSLGAEYHWRSGPWRSRLKADLLKSNYGGSAYQTMTSARALFDYRLPSHQKLRADLRYDDIRSDNALYDYLEGSRQRLGLTWYGGSRGGYWNVGYRLELNDRRDLGTTASYSPTRHELRGRYLRYLSGGWEAGAYGSLRHSDYPSADIGDRVDDRLRLTLDLRLRLQKRTRLKFAYEYTDNRSTVDNVTVGTRTYGYSYTRNRLLLSLDHRF